MLDELVVGEIGVASGVFLNKMWERGFFLV
jgi:hypothetical protein